MAEPQPSNVTEGADAPDVVPANAEDRKAAAAMNSLDTRGEDETKGKKDVDMKAVQEAMKNLEAGAQPQGKTTTISEGSKKEDAPKKPLVKVDAGDVALMVSFRPCSLLFPAGYGTLRIRSLGAVGLYG